jgi:hypothetical protein
VIAAARRRFGPELANHLGQEGPSGSQVSLGVPDRGLDQRLIAEHRLHGPGFLGAGQLEECEKAGAGQS